MRRGNSLECGDLSPLWPAAAWRRIVEEHSNNKGCDSLGDEPKRRQSWHSKALN